MKIPKVSCLPGKRHKKNIFHECDHCGAVLKHYVQGRARWMPKGTPGHWDYEVAVSSRFVGKQGPKKIPTYVSRTKRGQAMVTRNWMKKHPWLFTDEARAARGLP